MGGLHVDINIVSLLGGWLEGGGWIYITTSANVTTKERAIALQKGSHTTRSQWARQVTAAALFILPRRSYAEYHTTLSLIFLNTQFPFFC